MGKTFFPGGLYVSSQVSDQPEAVKADINHLLEAQVLWESRSIYASCKVFVRKKDGNRCMCMDNNLLNSRKKEDEFPLRCIKESLDALYGASIWPLSL